MTTYNWQQDDWPTFTYTLEGLQDELYSFAERVGRISGLWDALPEDSQQEAVIDMMVAEAIKTSEIEGEYLSRKDVMSSIRKNLGLHSDIERVQDRRARGVSELMIDVRNTFSEPLRNEKLFTWHRMLLGESDEVRVGEWRTHEEPMQVISGAMGKEKIHYEAPPSSRVPHEMDQFIIWFNETAPGGRNPINHPSVRSGLAHLYFETIHPFEDGNGRIGRAVAEKALSQGIGRPALLSLSNTIESNKSDYYQALEKAQRSNKVSGWVEYFVHTVLDAQSEAEELVAFTLQKTKFFDRFDNQLNKRQRKVVKRMLGEGPAGFEGGMNARKYVGIAKTSKSTATRDLQHLLEIGAFKRLGKAGGRSTRYRVNLG